MKPYIIALLMGISLTACLKEGEELVPKADCSAVAPFENTHTLASEIESLLDQALADGLPGASLVVSSGTKGDLLLTKGYADIGSEEALEHCHSFRAASLTKTMMATAFIQLHEQGLIDLQSLITDLLPSEITDGLAKADETTVAELLSHTSGIPNYDDNGRFVAAVLNEPGKELTTLQRLNWAKELEGTPDWVIEKFGLIYSNTNYLLLELILEEVTGEPFESYLKKEIIGPAAMASASFSTEVPFPAQLSSGYCDMYDKGYLRDVNLFDAQRGSGDAALIANASDVYRMFKALQNAELTSEDSWKTMQAEHYGLLSETIAGTEAIGHDGLAIGYSSEMWHLEELDLSIVLMANQGRISGDQPSIAVFEQLLVDLVKLHQ